MNESRLAIVKKNLEKMGLEQILITNPMSIKFLTGYYVEPFERFFALYFSLDAEPVLFVNSLFPSAKNYASNIVTLHDTDDPFPALLRAIDSNRDLGVDQNLIAKWLLPLQQEGAATGYRLASTAVDEARAHKMKDEQEAMISSSKINDECMAWLMDQIREGVTERELANGLLQLYLEKGATGPSFDPIISFGAQAADPHHSPDDTKLRKGDCVLFDIGCVYEDYCSDMTRTAFFGEPSDEFLKAYNLVLSANEEAEKLVKPGVLFSTLDQAARSIIEEGGYGKNFTHRLGHSIGLEDHEPGDVSSAHHEPVEPGNAFSIEPGIYVEGKFGIRIEDLVLVTEDGHRVLNHYPKELKVFN